MAEFFHVLAHISFSIVIVFGVAAKLQGSGSNLSEVLLFEGDGDDFEGGVAEVDYTVVDFEFMEGIFFEVAEPGPFDRLGGVKGGVTTGVMGFVDSGDAVV